MSQSLFDRLSSLRPALAGHVRVHMQEFRGERWYVLADDARGSFMRLNACAYMLIGRLDGGSRLDDLYTSYANSEDWPSHDEAAQLLLQLDAIDALREPLPDDVRALTGRRAKTSRFANPLSIRFALLDPDRLLTRLLPFVRPLFSTAFALFAVITMLLGALLAVVHFDRLAGAINLSLFSPGNLIIAYLTFAVIKTIHEFGHAFAVKHWGGEVHEMGISLLVLMPVPYVDATAAWAMRSKYRRALVGAAGILVEFFIAAVALVVWLLVEPGLISSIALNAVLIGGVSSVLVNANPLLRFDGYYVLQDMAELPNLSTRSSQYLRYLLKRYVMRDSAVSAPACARGERGWLIGYGIAAACYRLFALALIGLFLAGKFLLLGVALLVFAVFTQLLLPLFRGISYIVSTRASVARRVAIAAYASAPVIALGAALFFVPVGFATTAHGVIWLPEQAQVYARTAGFVHELQARDGAAVEAGTAIASLQNPDLTLHRQLLLAREKELKASARAQRVTSWTRADVTKKELASLRAEREALDRDIADLQISSPHTGRLVYVQRNSLAGRYFAQGELIAYVVKPDDYIVRSVVPQRDIGRLRHGISAIEVQFAERLGQPIRAEVLRETPAGHRKLPSRALSVSGGGKIETDPSDEHHLRTRGEVFDVDIRLPADTAVSGIGGRAYVRYQHPPIPLASQWYQRLRQLLLSRLSA